MATAKASAIPEKSSLEHMLQDLRRLEQTVQKRKEEFWGYKQANTEFDVKNPTTQLLLQVCEKLVIEKTTMDQANFAEHTSDLSYLCKHYGCSSLDAGLSDTAYREKLSATSRPAKAEGSRKGKGFFGFCCQMEFPPQQAWWTDVNKRLVPKFQAVRAGKLVSTWAADVVLGDVLYLEAGQKAAADGRILVVAEGTTVDASHLSPRATDVRACSIRATAATPAESTNIVLKGSYVVTGAMFCMVVRTPKNPFVADKTNEEGHEFVVNTTIPPGMSLSSCQRLFKSLCTKAHFACRSFWAVSQLSQSGTLVVLLTKELLDKGTVPAFCGVAKRLGKALILVNCDCPRDALGSLSKDVDLQCIDFAELQEASGEFANPSSSLPTEAADKPTQSCSGRDSHHTFVVGAATSGMDALEKVRINLLATQLIGGGAARQDGAVLQGISQAGLLSLCKLLRSTERPLVYAMSGFQFPRCFRNIMGYRTNGANTERYESSPPLPRVSTSDKQSSEKLGDLFPTPIDASKAMSSPRGGGGERSRGHSPNASPRGTQRPRPSFADSTHSVRSTDPASALNVSLPNRPNGANGSARGSPCADLLVSLNSIGVVSELADCVLLKSDLGLLGQALEIAHKG